MTSAASMSNVRVRLGGRDVLRGVSLSVQAGECCVVLGPSGSGKTTLLRALAGLQTIDEGNISIGGSVANDPKIRIPAEKRGVGMVFQSLALWPHKTVEAHLSLVLAARRVTKETRAARIAELISLARLAGKEKRVPAELSGGEAQRLAIARALAGDPQILLLDEPFGSLDESLRAELLAELLQLHRKLRLTMVFVTHHQSEGIAIAKQLVVLNEGRVEQSGSPAEILANPASPFVARFLGKRKIENDAMRDELAHEPHL
jgi:ABC-type Fe3+/spermidine/putrescine transport system ATPase subunit